MSTHSLTHSLVKPLTWQECEEHLLVFPLVSGLPFILHLINSFSLLNRGPKLLRTVRLLFQTIGRSVPWGQILANLLFFQKIPNNQIAQILFTVYFIQYQLHACLQLFVQSIIQCAHTPCRQVSFWLSTVEMMTAFISGVHEALNGNNF